MPDVIVAALRFKRSDAPKLRWIAHALEVDRPADDKSVFHRAADSAEVGDPLIVKALTVDEVTRLADRFSHYGITRPAIDELRQS